MTQKELRGGIGLAALIIILLAIILVRKCTSSSHSGSEPANTAIEIKTPTPATGDTATINPGDTTRVKRLEIPKLRRISSKKLQRTNMPTDLKSPHDRPIESANN